MSTRGTIPRFTARQVADMIGRKQNTVQKAATQHSIGTHIHPRLKLYSQADVDRLRQICHGRPGKQPKEAAA